MVPAPAIPSVAVVGAGGRFPVRRIFCIGRNYAAHAREMGEDPDREPPLWFTKPADAAVPAEGVLPYPPATAELHHEVELVVALGDGGADIAPEVAMDRVYGYALGIDLTRRDLQRRAKARGRPWDTAKGFDASAPLTPIAPRGIWDGHRRGRIWLAVNGRLRQDGDLGAMIWTVPEAIAALSRLFTLAAGDLIFTGTPAGVGPLERGDIVTAGIEGLAELELSVG